MPETPEPVVEALREIADAERVENADPLEWAVWAHDFARQALASLTDEPRPTPVPQGLVERVRSATDKLDRYFRQEPHDRIGSGMGQEALRELRAALDTPTESVSGSEVRELREALEKLLAVVDAETIERTYAFPNARRLTEAADIARRALAPDPEGGNDG